MTEKECSHHDEEELIRLIRGTFVFCIGLIILILFTIFLIFLILHPSKPSFILRDATIYQFNATTSSASYLTTDIQVTISSRNPNARISIYYLKLHIYASYRGQQITLPTLLPDSYQGHKEVTDWSPFVYGNSVPVSPYLAGALSQDQNAGSVLISVKIDGRVKWKVGNWVSGKYHLHVNCPALLVFKPQYGAVVVGGDDDNGVGPGMKIQLAQHCNVDV